MGKKNKNKGEKSENIKNELDSLFKSKKIKKDKEPVKTPSKPSSDLKSKSKDELAKILFEKQNKVDLKKEKKESKIRQAVDGFNVYTEEELGLNNPKAGTTENCPFDCECCF